MNKIELLRAEQSRAEQLDYVHVLGQMDNTIDHTFESANRVYDDLGIAPTVNTCGGGGLQPKVIEVNKMEQYGILNNGALGILEVSDKKDDLILGKRPYIKIRQATKDGFIDCELPGVADLEYPESNTRRGRVQQGGRIVPTLTTENIPSVIELGDPNFYNFLYEIDGEIYLIRIRKLIPKECWALMDFNEGAFEKAEKVNSATQLYKQAGNSICVNVLCGVFGQMLPGKENFYKDI